MAPQEQNRHIIRSHMHTLSIDVLLTVALIFMAIIPVNMVTVAYAGEYDLTIGDNGSIQPPTTVQLGDSNTHSKTDDGIATYVGGNMYVGHKVDNIFTSDGPTGSYAVEAEGLTVVNGKVMLHPLKKSWSGKGFRFGIVGFGSQLRPAAGQPILVVGNNTDTIPIGMNSAFQAWGYQGWFGSKDPECRSVGSETDNVQCNYKAHINGNFTQQWDSQNASLFVEANDGSITWNKPDAMDPYANFKTDHIDTLSNTAAGFTNTGSADFIYPNEDAYSLYKVSSYTRSKYDYNSHSNNDTTTYSFDFDPDKSINKEVILEFKGTNNPSREVFTIDASVLNNLESKGYTGLSYAFKDINENASIVINVDTSLTNGTVNFHNGWRFYNNGTDISNGYVIGNEYSAEYSQFASRIIWNFNQAVDVTIRGGYAEGDMKVKDSQNNSPLIAPDDPAAALIGTVVVPNGRFESHVSTNGRVWVGGDFEMYNDQLAKNDKGEAFVTLEDTNTASVIDMDQERHNFRVSLEATTEAASIGWQKIRSDGDKSALGGTTWGVYKTKDDAIASHDPLYIVQDNGNNEWNSTAGTFEIHNLTPNANYYIKEASTVDGYQVNSYTYLIQAKAARNEPYTEIVKAYDAQGNEVADLTNVMLDNNRIMNQPRGAELSWSKKDDTTDFVGLVGSQWNLYSGNSTADGALIETITDLVAGISDVQILHGDDQITDKTLTEIIVGQQVRLSAQVSGTQEGVNVPQDVTWLSSAPDKVTVTNGVVSVLVETNEAVTITATSNADPTKSASVYIVPKSQQLTSLKITNQGQIIGNTPIPMHVDDSLQLGVQTDPAGLFNIVWSTDESGVLSIDSTGKVTAQQAGSATVTASFGGQTDTIAITVTDLNHTTIYFDRSAWTTANNQKLYLYGGWDSKSGWQTVEMTTYCGNWMKVTVPGKDFNFLILRENDDENHKKNDAYLFKNKDGKDFFANSNFERERNEFMVYGDHLLDAGIPSCDPNPGTTSTTNTPQMSRSRTLNQSLENTSTLSETQNSVPYPDMDPAAGKFKLQGLPDGIYTLQESQAPAGYYRNAQAYKITIANQEVTWSPELIQNPVDGSLWITNTQTEVIWHKIDSQNDSLLGGSEWSIAKKDGDSGAYNISIGSVTDCTQAPCIASDDSALLDVSPDSGKIQIKGLSAGSYRLEETKAPNGYQFKSNTYYYFEITNTAPDAGYVSITTADGTPLRGVTTFAAGSMLNPIPNERQTGSVTWCKVGMLLGATDGNTSCDNLDSSSQQLLAGSEWTLTYIPYGKTESDKATCAITDTSSNCTLGDESNEIVWATKTATKTGNFTLTGLPWGTYTLVESKAPDGYTMSTKTHTFQIGPITNEEGPISYNFIEEPITIINTTTVQLPETGGSGSNTLSVLVGFAITTFAMLALAVLMHRERRTYPKM